MWDFFAFSRQKKIDHATNITSEIVAYAYQIFKASYEWSKPIRSVGVRGADLVTDNYLVSGRERDINYLQIAEINDLLEKFSEEKKKLVFKMIRDIMLNLDSINIC